MYILTLLLAIALLCLLGTALLGRYLDLEAPVLGLGVVTGLLLHSYLLFLFCSIGILPNTLFSGVLLLLLLGAATWFAGGFRWWASVLPRVGWAQLVELAAFLVLFLGYCWVRARNPQIWGEEKFMDFTFLNGIWRSYHFPPNDPWFAGGTINYYYFGYLMMADLARLTGIPTGYFYNLALAMLFALSFVGAFSITRSLTRSIPYGLLGGVMLVLCGNLDGALQALNGHVEDFSYWKSSRVVDPDNTINEFPFFSFIHADLHPHVMSIPLLLLLLFVLLRLLQRPELLSDFRTQPSTAFARTLPLAVLLGALPCTNVADLPTFWGLTALALLAAAFRRPPTADGSAQPGVSSRVAQVGAALLVAFVVAYLLYLPFHLRYESDQVKGLGLVTRRSVWTEFMVVHGIFFYVLASELFTRPGPLDPGRPWRSREPLMLALVVAGSVLGLALDSLLLGMMGVMFAALGMNWLRSRSFESPEAEAANLFILTALGLLAGCELVYVADFYGGALERLNTVFKFYYQAWILLALVTPWCLMRVAERFAASPRFGLWRTGFGLLLAATLVYPVLGTRARYFRDEPAGTLYGMDHLVRYHADEHQAMLFLQQEASPEARLLELPGPPYQYAGRFSANTGIPTLLGWVQHEAFWRDNTYALPRAREAEARLVYTAPSLTPEVRRILDQYAVRYIVVGEVERQEIPAAGLAKFAQLPVAFQRDKVTVYRWEPARI